MTKSTAFNISLLMGLILAIVFSNFFSFVNEYQALETGVLRMHILANSDSEADQSLKIKVRDRILENSDIIFGDCSSKETAKTSVKLDKIKKIAEQVISENNYSYDVKCYLVNMQFDDRQYQNLVMPHGTYDAVRVEIGNAEGKNWWCVMYPPLCLPPAEKTENVEISDYAEMFTAEQVDIMENPQDYEIKFKCVEIFERLKDSLGK